MGEVLFRYWPENIPLLCQTAFSYWYARASEYSFVYHRYFAPKDMNRLKDPVAITKVASGFRRIEDAFWLCNTNNIFHHKDEIAVKTNHTEIKDSFMPITKSGKEFSIIQSGISMYLSKEMQVFNMLFIDKDIDMNLYYKHKPLFVWDGGGKDMYRNEIIDAVTLDKITVINKEDIADRHFPDVNIYEQIIGERTKAKWSVYEQIITDKTRPDSNNIFQSLPGAEHWLLMDLYNYLYSSPYNKEMNRMRNDNAEREKDDLLNELPVINAEPGSNMFQLERYEDVSSMSRATNVLKILENLYMERLYGNPLMKLEKIQESGLTRPDPIWKIFEQIITSMDDIVLNHHEDIFGKLPDNVLNPLACLFGWRDDPQVVIRKDELYKNKYYPPQVNWIEQVYTERPQPNTNIIKVFLTYKKDDKYPTYLPSVDILSIYNTKAGTNIFHPAGDGNAYKDTYSSICNIEYTVQKPANTDTILNMDTFALQVPKYSVVFKDINALKGGENSFVFEPILAENMKAGYSGAAIFHQLHLSENPKDTMIMYRIDSLYNAPKDTNITYGTLLDKNGKMSIVQYVYPSGYKIAHDTFIDYDSQWVEKPINPGMIEYLKTQWIDKLYHNTAFAKPQNLLAKRESYSMYLTNKFVTIEKSGASINDSAVKEQEEFVYRIRYSMRIDDQAIDIWREPYHMELIPVDGFLQRSKYELQMLKDFIDHVYDASCILSRFTQPDIIHKLSKPMRIVESFEDITRSAYDMNLFLGISKDSMVFVPITKTYRPVFIDRMDEMFHRYAYTVKIPFKELITTLLPKPTWIDYNPDFIFREPYPAMLDYKNQMAFKLAIKTQIQYAHWTCDKLPKDVFIDYRNEQVIKLFHDAWVSQNVHIKKGSKEFEPYPDSSWLQKENKKMWIEDNVYVLFDCPYDFSIYCTDAWLSKTPNLLYYTYGVFIEDPLVREIKDPETPCTVVRENPEMDIYAKELWADNRWRDIFIEDIAFTGRQVYENELFQQALDAHRQYKEIEKFTQDFSNWAWVYEIPDPFEPVFGIDELLLPENDTRYSDLNEIIFDSKNMRPRSPVKKIDDTTFIAKYPTKHPFPERADVGRHYDDSAIEFENYYGIESEVMYQVYLQFFKIWQAKIFEFGGMDMVGAMKKMLEYIYTWIIGGGLPLEKIEQGLRVYRQIRWFAESSVIKNSQYIVTYDLDNLRSNLHTGNCDIPNDIQPGGSMYIDPALAVIRNDPSTINNGPASVTFYLNTCKNTIMSFSLLNTVGSVNIYVDGVLKEIRSASGRISVDLIYTGGTIEVKIEKDAVNNRNKYFYIGDIVVPDMSFKDLKVTFDPTLKMGNKPLDEVMKKMLQYAGLYDDINEAYNKIRKGNLGVNETYRLMLQYWELHHKGKTKGKRLTIKKA